jgi:hypothetical protein
MSVRIRIRTTPEIFTPSKVISDVPPIMYQSLSLTLKRGKKGCLVFVTKHSRKQNLFFQNKFIILCHYRVGQTKDAVKDVMTGIQSGIVQEVCSLENVLT